MNSGKSKDKRKQTKTNQQDQIIDASPGDGLNSLTNGQKLGAKPKNVQETEAWKDGTKRVKRIWGSYVNNLKLSFQRMPRAGQLELITKGSIVVTMGVAVVSLGLFYYFLPTVVRIFALPLVLVAAWFTATKLVAPIIKDRLEPYMNFD
jgi:hypothetical protein